MRLSVSQLPFRRPCQEKNRNRAIQLDAREESQDMEHGPEILRRIREAQLQRRGTR